MALTVRRKLQIALDLLSFIAIGVVYATTEYVAQPIERVYFPGDDSLRYPYAEHEKVPTYLLAVRLSFKF